VTCPVKFHLVIVTTVIIVVQARVADCLVDRLCCLLQTLYKTQVRELKEEVDEKLRLYVDLDTDFKNLENDR